MSFEQSFEYLLKWEGGYSNLAADPGGATNLGVIQEEYDRFRHSKGLLPQSVRHITNTEAGEIYKTKYWDAVRCESFNPGVANALFDASVNSGTSRGVRWLQQAINQLSGHEAVKVDESCGPLTIAAANAREPDKLIDAMLLLRLAFMKVAKNPKTGAALWPVFGLGWSDRINGVRKQSHALTGKPVPKSTTEQKTMGNASTIPANSTVAANPVVAAAVKAATAPVKSIWSSLTGMLSSAAGGAAATVLTTLAPNLTGEIVGVLGIIAAIVSIVAHIYALVSGQIATNNATIALAENLLNEIEGALGGKPFTFDNSPTSAAS